MNAARLGALSRRACVCGGHASGRSSEPGWRQSTGSVSHVEVAASQRGSARALSGAVDRRRGRRCRGRRRPGRVASAVAGLSRATGRTWSFRPGTRFPIARKITIGLDKSMLIELPVDLQNVLVSNPEVVDAVVQSSRQLYLLAQGRRRRQRLPVRPRRAEARAARGHGRARSHHAQRRAHPPAAGLAHQGRSGRRQRRADGQRPQSDRCQPRRRHRRPLHQEEGRRRQHAGGRHQGAGAAQGAGGRDAARRHPPHRRQRAGRPPELGQHHLHQGHPERISGDRLDGAGALALAPARCRSSPPARRCRAPGLGSNTVSALVEALERAGLIRTLAEPNLTAISGETAKFLAGGEFPVPIASPATGRSRSAGRPSASTSRSSRWS